MDGSEPKKKAIADVDNYKEKRFQDGVTQTWIFWLSQTKREFIIQEELCDNIMIEGVMVWMKFFMGF